MMRSHFLLVLLTIATTANAVVVRSDVADSRYRVPASAFPALADLPDEGHGVLIAPQWVVTAAHAAPTNCMECDVSIGGVARKIKRVVTYPGYRKLPDAVVNEFLSSHDPSGVYAFLASSDDIALVELAAPVTDVTPIPLFRGNNEMGMTAELAGKGATGNGSDGQDAHSSHRGVLRHAFNIIEGANTRYVWYRFDPPPTALPLEGITGSGDSGGPLLIGQGRSRQLIGLASWGRYPANHPFWKSYATGGPFREGLYGEIVYAVRVSSYVQWMDSVMSAQGSTVAPSTMTP